MKLTYCFVVLIASTFVNNLTNGNILPSTASVKPTSVKVDIVNQSTSHDIILSNSVKSVVGNKVSTQMITPSYVPSMIKHSPSSTMPIASDNVNTRIMSSNMTTQISRVMRSFSVTPAVERTSSNTENTIKATISTVKITEMKPSITTMLSSQFSVKATVSSQITGSQSSFFVRNITPSSDLINPTLISSMMSFSSVLIRRSSIVKQSDFAVIVTKSNSYSMVTESTNESSIIVQAKVSSHVNSISSSLMKNRLTTLVIASVDQNISQSTMNAIKIPISNSPTTQNATKLSITHSTMSSTIHANATTVDSTIKSSYIKNTMMTSMGIRTSLLVMPDKTTLLGMMNSTMSPVINGTNATTASTVLMTVTLTSVVPNMTTPPVIMSNTIPTEINVTVSSPVVIAITTSIKLNATLSTVMANRTKITMIDASRSSILPTRALTSINISLTTNVTTPSAMLNSTTKPALNETKSSLTNNITTVSLPSISSLSVLSNMTTSSTIVQSTVSSLLVTTSSLTGNATSSPTTGFTATTTVNMIRSSGTLNSTLSPSVTKLAVTANGTIASTMTMSITISPTTNFTKPPVKVNSTMSPMTSGSVAITDASMTSTMVINTTTSATLTMMIMNRTMSPTMNMTRLSVMENTTIKATPENSSTRSVLPNIIKSSRLLEMTMSSARNVTISPSLSLSLVATINGSETMSRNTSPTITSLRTTKSSIFTSQFRSTIMQTISPDMITTLKTVIRRVSSSSSPYVTRLPVNSPTISSVSSSSYSGITSSSTSIPSRISIVLVRITIDANCTTNILQSAYFRDEVRKSLSMFLNIQKSAIKITGVSCGSIVVNTEITKANNDSIITKLENAVASNQLNIFYNGTQLRVTAVKKLTKTSTDDESNTTLIIYIVVGAVLGLAFIIGVIALIVRCRRERSAGIFHLPSEEHLELSGFSGHRKSNYQAGNFYGELEPDTNERRVTDISDDDVTNDLAGKNENGGGFGSAYLPAWKNLPTMDMSEVSQEDADTHEVNDNLLLTYGKESVEAGKDSGKKENIASFDNVGAI